MLMPRKLAPRLWEVAQAPAPVPAPAMVPPPSELDRALERLVERVVRRVVREELGKQDATPLPRLVRLGDTLAKQLGVSGDTLRRWRQDPTFPELEGWAEVRALAAWLGRRKEATDEHQRHLDV